MKKYLLLLLLIIMPGITFAAGISVSKTSVNVTKGRSVNVTVTANSAYAIITPSVSNGNVSINKGKFDLDGLSSPDSTTITITGNQIGSSVINLALNGADINETPLTHTISINVNVVEPTTKAPTTEATTEPTTTTEATTIAPSDISINNIKIVGYNLEFDKNKNEYTINVDKDTNELYVIVEGDNLDVEGNGLIDIKDKDSFDIKVKQGGSELTYKIKLNKTEGKKSNNIGLYICITVLSLLALGLTILVVYLAKKN